MVALRIRKTTTLIGVDFGTCSLRAIQLRRRGNHWHVHHWVNLETEPNSAEPPPPHSAKDLQLAFGPGTFSGQRIALALSPPDVNYHLLDVPNAVLKQPPAQLRTALQIELDRQMPWPMTESEVAAWSLKPEATGKAPAMIVAAHRDTLESRLALLGEQRLECEHADIIPNAMIRLQQAQQTATGHESSKVLWGILDLGFQSCRLYLIHADRPVYARIIRTGGREWTETLAKTLHVNFAIAERYKRVYGIQATDRGLRSMLSGLTRVTEDELPSVLYGIMRPIIDEMAREIERSYRFAMGQWAGVQAGPLYLVGGGSRLRGLVDVLSARLGVPVCLPDPTALFGVGKNSTESEPHPVSKPSNYAVLAPCIGLVLNRETP